MEQLLKHIIEQLNSNVELLGALGIQANDEISKSVAMIADLEYVADGLQHGKQYPEDFPGEEWWAVI